MSGLDAAGPRPGAPAGRLLRMLGAWDRIERTLVGLLGSTALVIAVVQVFGRYIDPENAINESFKNNNTATSGPVVLRLLGSDGSTTVPNQPYAAQLLPAKAPVVPAKARSPVVVRTRNGTKRLYRRPPAKQSSVIHELTIFPKQVNNLIKKFV